MTVYVMIVGEWIQRRRSYLVKRFKIMCSVSQVQVDSKKILIKNLRLLCNYIRKTSVSALAPAYQPAQVENGKVEKIIEISRHDQNLREKKANFSMLLPPPNVTGNLHLGHALMATVQDVICRQYSQSGYKTRWTPGTDHAGIATQVVVEKVLLKEHGLTRYQLGRQEFVNKIEKWQLEKQQNIRKDLKELGCILNWNREYYTMDKNQAYAVNEAFIKLFEEGFIKRQKSLVNWSCALRSAISDIEVEFLDIKQPTQIEVPGYNKKITFGRIYDIDYKVLDSSSNEYITVSTTRPETILGDVAVAVHPNDERYCKYRNLSEVHLWHPLRKETIPLIFDIEVDSTVGTGAVKITPAHDRQDFHIAQKHNINGKSVINERGMIVDGYGSHSGKPRFNAREDILQELHEYNLLRKIKDHAMQLPMCSRSKDVVEYMLRDQWFVICQELANEALSEVLSGRMQIIPSNHEVDWRRWLEDCHDWCISRQLWWGHQIPAYKAFKTNGTFNDNIWVAAHTEGEAVEKASKILNTKDLQVSRDEDVLDTWFSSALLPFSTAGWPFDLCKQVYPLNLMVTGHDILFFWIARMVMLGLKLTGQAPFKKVLLNGIVCDSRGRKMSKSLGNIIRPHDVIEGRSLEALQKELQLSHDNGILSAEEMKKSLSSIQQMFPQGIPQCGTDALRFTLCSYNIKNTFINFDVQECYTNKLFFNKIWQATRFTLRAAEVLGMPLTQVENMNHVPLTKWDNWILSRLCHMLHTVRSSFEEYNLHIATGAFKQFLYNNLCDTYLETTKSDIYNKSSRGYIHCATLATCLSWSLNAMSSFTPFLSDELIRYLPQNIALNMVRLRNIPLEQEIDEILRICQSIRQLKSCNGIIRQHEPHLVLYAHTNDTLQLLQQHLDEIQSLCQTQKVTLHTLNVDTDFAKEKAKYLKGGKFIFQSTSGPTCSFSLITNDMLKFKHATDDKNRRKLKKLEDDLQCYLERWQNIDFRKCASREVQRKHETKIQHLQIEIEKMKTIIN